jgi:putative Ca2+/H+ antiporter (TMEM165/GDT1 family)
VDWLTAAAVAFALIVPVELPDKTFVATLVLATRYRPVPVWLGVVAAFGIQCVVAVAAGRLLTLLPERPVELVAGALFAVGAIVLFRHARTAAEEESAAERAFTTKIERDEPRTGWRAAGMSFLVLFTAEWGDLSQLLTAGLVASGRPALPVFVGSWAGLAVVSAAAVLLGRVLLRRVRLSVVRYVAAGVCAVLAVITVVGALT